MRQQVERRRRHLSRLATSAVALVAVLTCAARSETSVAGASDADPRWRIASVWRQPQGLTQDSVLSLLQSRDGYLWVGTRGGLARFDGVQFTTFDDRNRSQLGENEVWALEEGEDGSLWIGTFGGGVSRLKDGQFTIYTTRDGLSNDVVRALTTDGRGGMWIGTEQGLSHLSGGKFRNYNAEDGLGTGQVDSLFRDRDNSLWVGTSGGGLFQIRDERIVPVMLPEPRPLGVESMLRDAQGALWFATHSGAFRLHDGKTTKYTTAEGLSSNWVARLALDKDGQLWILTDKGLDRYLGPTATGAPIAGAVLTSDAQALLPDREGSVWLGYIGAGIAQVQQRLFDSYAEPDGLPDPNVYAALEDTSGNLWIGSRLGLTLYRNHKFTVQPFSNTVPNPSVTALAETSDGQLWVGTEGGLFRSLRATSTVRDGQVLPLSSVAIEGVSRVRVRVILQDSQGTVWVGLNTEGLARLKDGQVQVYTTKNGLSSNYVRGLAEDRDGHLWVATRGGGLNKLKDGRVVAVYSENEGLPSKNLQALHMDGEGTLWIASRRGLVRLKDGSFSTCDVNDGLFVNHTYGFAEDDSGNLWMSGGKGVFRVNKKELHDFAEGRTPRVRSVPYGREHGFHSTMAAVGYHPVITRARDGRLWFATLGGLASVDPRRLQTNKVPPPVHIESVSVDERPVPLGEEITAAPGKGDLVFRYTALSFLAPDKVAFRYKLEGFDADWKDVGTRRTAFYTNLPPGPYRFRVLAANNDGVWNEAGASIDLRLRPHFYETYWFFAASVAAVALLGAATQRLRVKRLQQRERELSSRVEDAVAQIRVLRGLLPVCAWCKKIRDDRGSWYEMETYIHARSEADFTHGICPDCATALHRGAATGQERQ
jgi:ligand-binding sensor domain-containing protein